MHASEVMNECSPTTLERRVLYHLDGSAVIFGVVLLKDDAVRHDDVAQWPFVRKLVQGCRRWSGSPTRPRHVLGLVSHYR